MPICIECRYPVSQLYRVLQSRNNQKPTAPPSSTPSHKSSASSLANHTSPAKAPPVSHRGLPPSGEAKRTNTVSSDVRLTQCPRCKRFADKYVEHDYVVIFIDLVLVKPQVSDSIPSSKPIVLTNYAGLPTHPLQPLLPRCRSNRRTPLLPPTTPPPQ